MSLTSFLKDADEVRIVLDQTFEKPEIGITKERLAEPQTANYALIGTAFDYVLRFWLEREYSQVESKPWVAHQGLNLAQLMEMETTTEDSRDFSEVIASIEQSHQEYLETGDMTGELLALSLDLPPGGGRTVTSYSKPYQTVFGLARLRLAGVLPLLL
jgi:hypothetical protein